MVQFLSINVFSWISSIFVGFFKSSLFCVTLYNQTALRQYSQSSTDYSVISCAVCLEKMRVTRLF